MHYHVFVTSADSKQGAGEEHAQTACNLIYYSRCHDTASSVRCSLISLNFAPLNSSCANQCVACQMVRFPISLGLLHIC